MVRVLVGGRACGSGALVSERIGSDDQVRYAESDRWILIQMQMWKEDGVESGSWWGTPRATEDRAFVGVVSISALSGIRDNERVVSMELCVRGRVIVRGPA